MLAQLVEERLILLNDVRAEIQAVIDKFMILKRLLKRGEAKEGQNNQVRNWISDVVRDAHDVEDLVEDLAIKFQDKGPILTWMVHQVTKVSSNAPSVCIQQSKGISFGQLHRKILALNHKIDDIVENLQRSGFESPDNEFPNNQYPYYDQYPYPREYCPSFRKNHILGLEEPFQKLVGILIGNNPHSLHVLSITGMGGLGKTTLAQYFYNHSYVKGNGRFPCRAWVSVSQSYDRIGVLLDLSNQLMGDCRERTDVEGLPLDQLRSTLSQHLQQNRYFVVLDDIWRTDAFEDIIRVFPDMSNSSRIVITTRNNQVAACAGGTTHQMKLFMGGEEAWKLFEKRSRDNGKDKLDQELLDIGKHIYGKCLRLPLLLIGAGSYMSQKRLATEWRMILNTMTPLGPLGKRDNLRAILELSYKDLSYEAKSCFLRLGFFPRDHRISTKRLVHIWMADHLVLESEAERCLDELIDKNLVQKGKTRVDGKPKNCWMHPSIHELSILKAKEDIFLEIQSTSRYSYSSSRIRHKVILSESHSYFQPQAHAPRLRSVLFFLPKGTSIPNKQLDLICQQFSLLRVLDLEGLQVVSDLPMGIGKLRYLRYLNLRNAGLTNLQESMSNLQELLALDIRGNRVSNLNAVNGMRNLRHLYLDRDSTAPRLNSLPQLRSIGWISQYDLVENVSQKTEPILIKKLKLKISPSTCQEMRKVWRAMATWEHLESLKLWGANNVFLTNYIPLKIKQLTLHNVNINSETMTTLAKFPNLSLLCLKELSIKGRSLTFNGDDFKCLTHLELFRLYDLEELKGNRVRQLDGLRILHCHRLTRRPKKIAGVLEIL